MSNPLFNSVGFFLCYTSASSASCISILGSTCSALTIIFETKECKHRADTVDTSVTSFTSALTMKQLSVLMSKNFHRLPRMSQASLASLKWIIKRCYGMLSQGGCHLCQLLNASCTAGLLLAPTSSLKEKNDAVRCCGIPAQSCTQSWF